MHYVSQVAHVVIFLTCIVVCVQFAQAIQAIHHLSRLGVISGILMFAFIGLYNLTAAVGVPEWATAVVLVGLALSMIVFLIRWTRERAIALVRLRLAFKAIQQIYGKDGDRMIATVTTALRQGKYSDDDRTD